MNIGFYKMLSVILITLFLTPSKQLKICSKEKINREFFRSIIDSNSLTIIEKPIKYSKLRESLSIKYLKERHSLLQNRPTIKPKIIVLHYTDGGTIHSVYDYFNTEKIEDSRKFNKAQSELNVSSHYLIDRDGTVYHLVCDTLFARHIIGLNYCSIGVENIGSKSNPLTEKQVISNVKLVKYLCSKYPIEYLIGHSEYSNFRLSKYWKESNANYFTYKDDPGVDFMKKVRSCLTTYKLKQTP